MTTSFPRDKPGEIYERGLSGQSDIYVVKTGPAETKGYGPNIPLFYVETSIGELPNEDEVLLHLELYANCDPQDPQILTYEDLVTKAVGYQAAVRKDRQQQTDEFEALIGVAEPHQQG